MSAEMHRVWDKALSSFVAVKYPVRFLRGPIPWAWIARAANLPGASLKVGLALWRLSGAMKSRTVRLASSEVVVLGVSKSAKARALAALASDGLIAIAQTQGRMPIVTILDA